MRNKPELHYAVQKRRKRTYSEYAVRLVQGSKRLRRLPSRSFGYLTAKNRPKYARCIDNRRIFVYNITYTNVIGDYL